MNGQIDFGAIKSDGIFQTKEEINSWADQDGKNNATILPGDLKYVDYNGDGKITADDQVIIGRGDFPENNVRHKHVSSMEGN